MKKLIALVLSILVCLTAVSALAAEGVAYGVYNFEGEHPDSLIRATVETDGDKITAAAFDEKLIPVTLSGADGWAVVNEETAALLKGAVVANGSKTYAASFRIDGIVWNVDADLNVSSTEHGDFLTYVCTAEGGAWYFAQETAELLDAEGNAVATVAIGTKESVEHGVHFWPSPLLFPGNIEALENFVVANGVNYTVEEMTMGDQGWMVADAVTGATLAGARNYLLLAQEAFNNAK